MKPHQSTDAAPSLFHSIFVWLVLSQAYSWAAKNSPVQDCDEVFNYYEPTHYLTHGQGLQTWEYSPEFAIRSWAYAGLHAVLIKLGTILSPWMAAEPSAAFFLLRHILGYATATSTTVLYRTIYTQLGRETAYVFITIMGTSAGMFHASVAYLPSAFAMNCTMLAFSSFMTGAQNLAQGVFWVGVGALLGWPFAALVSLPFLLHEAVQLVQAYSRSGSSFKTFFGTWMLGIASCVALLVVICAIDSYFYGQFVLVPINIVLYNVFAGEGRGPDIYGTEPWHFYVKNLFINFNFWFILALASLPLSMTLRVRSNKKAASLRKRLGLVSQLPFYLWLSFMTYQPHKEERFMYPLYPALAFNAAISCHVISLWMETIQNRVSRHTSLLWLRQLTLGAVAVGFVALNWRRIYSLVDGYSAPLQVYQQIGVNGSLARPGDTVCVGKEWYRFPSSYFLPQGVKPKFVKSEFSGLLPGEFGAGQERSNGFGLWPAARAIPPGMNDLNKEDLGKYVDVLACTFLIDSQLASMPPTKLEPAYLLDHETWERVSCEKFLDAGNTSLLHRLFWLPEISKTRQYGEYCLLIRRSIARERRVQ